MAADQFSTLAFLMAGNQTEVDSTLSMDIWITTVLEERNVHFGFLLAALISAIFTIFIGIFQFFHVYKYISVIRLKNNMYYLIFLNPISVTCCFFGMASPRNAAFMYGVILSYHMLAIRISLDVMFNINGGRVTLSKMLTMNNERIRFNFFPFCILGRCLPSFEPSVNNIARFEMVVSQTCIVRVVLMVIDICVYREIGSLNNGWFFVSHSISVVSTMVALYFSYAISGVNRENSRKFRFHYLFMMVDWSQTFITFQKLGLDMLSFFNAYPKFLFPQRLLDLHFSESIYVLFFLYSMEVLLMSILISYLLRPSQSYIFDTYTGLRTTAPPTYMYLDDSDEGLLPALMDSDSCHQPSNEPILANIPDVNAATVEADNKTPFKDSPNEGVESTPKPKTPPAAKNNLAAPVMPAVIGVVPMTPITPGSEPAPPVVMKVEDEGDYEDFKSKTVRSLGKVLAAEDENKVAEAFYQYTSEKPTPPQ